MTEAEKELRELSEDLARVAQSHDEPRCIALAFCTPSEGELRLTMQQWIDLEAIRSPILRLTKFENPGELQAAARVFGLAIRSAEEAAKITFEMRDAIRKAFALALPMKPPAAIGNASDGFGSWLPMIQFLEVECGKSKEEARGYCVGEAFALLAATRRAEAWEAQGATYAQRDMIGKEPADGD